MDSSIRRRHQNECISNYKNGYFWLKINPFEALMCNHVKYIIKIPSTQITNTELSALIVVLVSKLLSRKVLFINRKIN